MRKLKPREQLFIVAFLGEAQGNARQAALSAGYAKASAHVTGSRLLTRPHVQAALEDARKRLESSVPVRAAIADATERRAILSGIARNGLLDTKARVQAIDCINRMDGLYVKKITHLRTLEDILAESNRLEAKSQPVIDVAPQRSSCREPPLSARQDSRQT